MKRKEVLDKYINSVIENYSPDEREDEIRELLYSNWKGVAGWNNLSSEIQEEFNNEKLQASFKDSKYNEILKFKLQDDFKGYRNEYLTQQTSLEITSGIPYDLESCPCCGYKTIEKRSDFEICLVCWWEDDGEDNNNTCSSGVNDVESLTIARFNFLEHGVYNPKRNDLKEYCDSPTKYIQGRKFELKGANQVIECNTNWVGKR